MSNLSLAAQQNLQERIEGNPYPGRGIVIGMAEDGALVQVYWIMGRSPNSRNRIFATESGSVWTEAADPSKVKDPSLIIYNAMRELSGLYIVTNGDQTDTIAQALLHGGSFETALATRNHEPDAPNYTPRISGLLDMRAGAPLVKLSVLKPSPFGKAASTRHFFTYDDLAPGFGHCVTTYRGDGDPLPAFEGEPYLLPLNGSPDSIANTFWDALNCDNKVSLAVKAITPGGARVVVRNKYNRV